MDDCTGWLGLAQANLNFGFWIKESLLRRGAGGGGGGAGDRQALLPNFGFWIWVLDVGFSPKTGAKAQPRPLAT
jgi:hypothetical protein